jgi:hypothetical protein
MDHLLAAELHVRYRRRVVPVYIGHSKADGARVHPAQHPPQVTTNNNILQLRAAHRTCRDTTLNAIRPCCSLRITEKEQTMLSTSACRRSLISYVWAVPCVRPPACELYCFRFASSFTRCSSPRHLRRQPGCVHIDGDVNVSMQSACASIASNVAAAKGALDWRWYLNKMRELSSFILHPPLPLCLDALRCDFWSAIDLRMMQGKCFFPAHPCSVPSFDPSHLSFLHCHALPHECKSLAMLWVYIGDQHARA